MKKYCLAAITLLIFLGCSNNNKRADASAIDSKNKIDSFFPVTSFIKGQILVLDSLPVNPLQLTISAKKNDSVWITKKELKPLLQPFLTPVITETNLTKYFKETRFNDQTLNAITFTYDPVGILPDSIALRHWDIYINPETGFVTKIYLVKQFTENNQSLTQQLTWQTDKQAKISTIVNKPDGNMELVKEVLFIWNFK